MYANYTAMHAHLKVVLDSRRPKKDHLFPVKIRITSQRKQQYFYTGVDLGEMDFQKVMNGSVRSELRNMKIKIQDVANRIQSIIDSMKDFSFHELNKQLEAAPESVGDLNQLFDKTINDLFAKGRIGSAIAYRDAKNSLTTFRKNLSFQDITPDFLLSYEAYMLSNNKSSTTIGIYLRHLRAIINQAIEKELIDRKNYPFGKNRYQIKAPRNIKKALTIDQIREIMNFVVDPGSTQQLAKDMWLLSYFCNGMNIVDILNLRQSNILTDTLHFDRAKTSKTIQNPKPIVVSLLPQSQEIIERWAQKGKGKDDYLFPVFNKTMIEERKLAVKQQFVKTINQHMKKIGEAIGFDKPLTTYAARHSFATVLKRSGASIELISESLGHQSLQTTEAYLDSFEDTTRRKFTEMLVPK